MPSAQKCSSPRAASASAPTFSAAAVTPPAPTRASISASARQPKSTTSRSIGPAAPWRKSLAPQSTAFSRWSRARESNPHDPDALNSGTSYQSPATSRLPTGCNSPYPPIPELVPLALQPIGAPAPLICGEEKTSSGFVLNHLAGKVGMTLRGIDTSLFLRKTPRQRSRVVTAFVFSLSSKKRSEEHTSELQSPCNLVC